VLIAVAAASPTFSEWKALHGKKYTSVAEELLRKRNFEATVERVRVLQAGDADNLEFGLNALSDLSLAEMRSYSKCVTARVVHDSMRTPVVSTTAPPDSIDWRTLGAVTGVKDQKQCGSCWAFGTIGMVEGVNFVSKKNLTSLSEQNLVSCAKSNNNYPNDGCNGGRSDWASEYVVRNKGVDTEASYPYTSGGGSDGSCKFNRANVGGTLSNYTTLPKGDENQLQAAVAIAPVVVAINVPDSFANYKTGVWSDRSCKNGENDLEHAVLCVGYGTSNGQDYWIVKNSWGLSWGDKGYILMKRNNKNMCGIATDAVQGFA